MHRFFFAFLSTPLSAARFLQTALKKPAFCAFIHHINHKRR
jgi:hypothetical protein